MRMYGKRSMPKGFINPMALLIAAWFVIPGGASAQPPSIGVAAVDELMREISNWGRWGDDDQLGTLNLITPAKRVEAARLVTEGISVSLAHNVFKERAPEVTSPFGHTITTTARRTPNGFHSDTYTISYHGYAFSHMDALCHMFAGGLHYNGFEESKITEKGSPHLSIINAKQGIFTRGVLMDIPRLKGVPFLEPGTAIMPEDLTAWEEKAGVKVGPGDVVLIRTGRWARREDKGAWNVGASSAGLHFSCAKWLRDRDAAMIGSDAASDLLPSPVEGISHPVHHLVLIGMGMPIFDNLDLEDVAREAARQERWAFLLTASPMAIEGGTGSPLNPIATF